MKVKIDYCKVVEDLMPLYCDELVSKETGDFIEYHMNQCSTCKKKYDNSCTELPDVRIDVVHAVDEDKFKSAKKFLLKVKKRIYMSGIFALIIIFIASAGSFFYGKQYNRDAPIKVKSAENFANKVVPGWERAQKAGQVVDLGITKNIPGTAAEVTFEKVWYTPTYTYVLYTVKEPKKKYLMASAKEIDIAPDKNMKNNFSMEPLGQRWGGISTVGYHQVMVFSGYDTPVPSKELTLKASNWITPNMFLKPGNAKAVEEDITVKLPLSDEYLVQKSENIKLDKTYEWEGRSLHITGLEVGASKTLLYGEARLKQGETLHHLDGTIKCGEQSTVLSYESITQGDTSNSFKFAFYGNALSEWPAEVSLDIKALEFRTSDTITIPVDLSLYADKKDKIKVAPSKETDAAFYDSSIRLWTVERGKWINLEIVEPSKKSAAINPYITLRPDIWIDPLNNYSSGLKVTNENGDILQINGTAGGNLEGPDKVGIGFGIDTEDNLWKTSKKIAITINKPIARLVIDQKIDIK
jgi:hypothetical protein